MQKNPLFLCREKKCWLAVPSWTQHTTSASRSILTPHISKVMIPEDIEPPVQQIRNTYFEGWSTQIWKYCWRCTHAGNVFYLFTDAQCPVHFIHYISHPLTSLSFYSSPEEKKNVYSVSKKSRIQFTVTICQDLFDEKTLYQFCY